MPSTCNTVQSDGGLATNPLPTCRLVDLPYTPHFCIKMIAQDARVVINIILRKNRPLECQEPTPFVRRVLYIFLIQKARHNVWKTTEGKEFSLQHGG